MVEIIVVLAVLGLLMSMAAPMLAAGKWRADAGVHEVLSGLNAAQRLAVLRQHDIVVTFLFGERALAVHRDEDNDGLADPGEDVRLVQLPESVGFGFGSAPAMAGDTIGVTFRDPGPGPRLVFHRNGSASEAGRIYIRPVEGSLSAEASAVRAVAVERSTGMVQCFSYSTSSWRASC